MSGKLHKTAKSKPFGAFGLSGNRKIMKAGF